MLHAGCQSPLCTFFPSGSDLTQFDIWVVAHGSRNS